tara:strand:+ start:1232 stop:2068 length:837 start_codon:yes stop_codon:yes gene_type:complete
MSSDGGNPQKMSEVEGSSTDVERGDSLSGENEVLVFTTDDTSDEKEEGGGSKCRDNRRCRFLIVLLVVLAVIVNLLILLSVFNAEPGSGGGITASIRGGSYSKKTCVNFDYGCCEIYDQCKIVTTNEHQHMDYKKINLDVYVTYAHDSIKSNCVSLRDIVNRYNRVYGKDDCGKHGCCPPINIGCDDVLHYHINGGNNQGLVDTYLENRTTLMSIKVPKNNTEGTNCWNKGGFMSGITHFTDKYEHGYPIPAESWSLISYIVCTICLWCFCASVMAKK